MEEKEFNVMDVLLLLKRKIMVVILIAIVGLTVGIIFTIVANKNEHKIEGKYVYIYSTEKEYKNALIFLEPLLPELSKDDDFKAIDLEGAIEYGNIAVLISGNEVNVADGTSLVTKDVKYKVDYKKIGISKELGFELVEKINLAYKNYFIKECAIDYKFNIKTYDDKAIDSSYGENPYTYYDLLEDMNNSADNLMKYIEGETIKFQNYSELMAEIKGFKAEIDILKGELINNNYSKENSIYQDVNYLRELERIKNAKEELLTMYKELDNAALINEYIYEIKNLQRYNEILDAYYDVNTNSAKLSNVAPKAYKDKLKDRILKLKEISDDIDRSSVEYMSDKSFKQFRVSKTETALGKRDIAIYLFGAAFVTFAVISGYLFVVYQMDKVKIKEKADSV